MKRQHFRVSLSEKLILDFEEKTGTKPFLAADLLQMTYDIFDITMGTEVEIAEDAVQVRRLPA